MRPFTITREIACRNAPEVVWQIVSDTERLNREVGLKRLGSVGANQAPGAARFVVSTRIAGFDIEYDEYPYEWVEGERISIKRVLKKGPVKSYETRWRLEPATGGGTRVEMSLTVEPGSPFLAPFARLNAGREFSALAKTIKKIDERVASRPKAVAESFVDPRASRVDEARFRETSAALMNALPERLKEVGRRIVAHVREASDFDLARMRPFDLADGWGLDRRDVAVAMVHAVAAGLVELSWDIVCPSCRTKSIAANRLVELSADGHCQMCDLRFGVEFDRTIEGTFHPRETIRKVDGGPYCFGGPARTPHVISQLVLPARGRVTVKAPSTPGRYRLFVRGGAAASVAVESEATGETRVEAGDLVEPTQVVVAPGGEIRIVDEKGEERHVKLERLDWSSRAATAHYLNALPEFRRLLPDEVLRSDIALRVASGTFLFSDLTGSTALYRRAGDEAAFRLVIDHFRLLGQIVEEHQGTVVKTMGDAVMAVFLDEAHALRAALAMQRRFATFRQTSGEPVDLKLGLYTGPCYVVTANKIIDYFGQSVNVASRLQGQARGGEIVIAADWADRAAASGELAGAKIAETLEVKLRGIDEPMRAARIVLT